MAALDIFVDPPFAKDLPIKLGAKPIGILLVVLAAVTGVLDLINLFSTYVFAIAEFGLILALIAEVMVVIGGWRMYRGEVRGKPLVIYGLALAFVAEVVYAIGFGFAFGDDVVRFIVIALLYCIVAVSQYPAQRPAS